MASVDQLQDVVVTKVGPRRPRDIGEERARLQRVELAADACGVEDVVALLGDELRDIAGDACDLLALLDQEIGEVVVQLDGRHRLDEERGAGAGALVEDAGNRIAMVAADRDAVAVASQDD